MAARTPTLIPETRTRLLDAAFEVVAEFGMSRLTMDDVAARAGMTRATLYRYFPSRDALFLELLLREEERFLDGVRAALAVDADLVDALEDSIAFCLRYARQHPLLDRLLETDPDLLLPYLTVNSAPVLERAAEVVGALVRAKSPGIDPDRAQVASRAAARLLVSYAINPPGDPPERLARSLAQMFGGFVQGTDGATKDRTDPRGPTDGRDR
ncbi:MAG: TetR family transcriptional regulator [Chloroflexota bacterium]